MHSLYFEKISQFDRKAEPVSVSIPFAKGRLKNAETFCILDDGIPLPSQNRTLSSWEDGSVKWLLVHMQADLPGNSDKTLHFALDGKPPASKTKLNIQESKAGITVDTGVLSFHVPFKGFFPITEVALEGKALWHPTTFSGFDFRFTGGQISSKASDLSLELEEAGPLRAVILIKGKHLSKDAKPYLDFHGRITAYADKPYIEIEYQFIHKEQKTELTLESLSFTFSPNATGETKLALGEGYYRTHIKESTTELNHSITAETLLYQANEHFIDSFYGDFWTDWRDESGGLALSVYQAHQNFPKGLELNQKGITCWLYPEGSPTARILQGMAKTHRVQLHFHAPDTSLSDLSTRSLQFQLPDRPSLSRAYLAENNPWLEPFPEKLPKRLITYFHALHDGRPKAHGMMHFGDAPDAHYTNQGRGSGETVWVNNEYDHPHACTLLYGLSGQRRMLDSALVSARHWLDVDFCHYSPDPLIHEGLKIHTAYHGTEGVTPSHEWVEGFLDYYALTGRTEALELVKKIGDNIMRHMATPDMSSFGSASVREGGWALRAMVGLYLGTADEKWKAEAERLANLFLGWYDSYGALLAPYTSHSMPRVPFMIALTVNSFARYLLIDDTERIKTLIVETMDDLLEHCLGPDGLFFYKELPSLQWSAPTPHALEALTHAYRITGKRHYLEIATRQFAALVEKPIGGASGSKYIDPSGAVIQGRGGGRIFADKYSSILVYASEAAPLGLLDWYDYPF